MLFYIWTNLLNIKCKQIYVHLQLEMWHQPWHSLTSVLHFSLPFSGKQKDYPLEMFFDSFTGELLICIWPFKARSSPLCFCVQSWLVANSDSISQGSRCASWNDFFFLSTNYNRYRNGRWMLYNPLRVIKQRQTPFRLLWQSTFSPFYSFQLLFKIFYYEIYFYVVDIFGFIL